jgi:hypothetical protein
MKMRELGRFGIAEVDPQRSQEAGLQFVPLKKPDADLGQDALTGTWNCRPA